MVRVTTVIKTASKVVTPEKKQYKIAVIDF